MEKFISETTAIAITTAILAAIIIFHLLIATGIVSYEIVWGGRIENPDQMIVMETISILVNLLMLVIIGLRARFLEWKVSKKVIRIGLWVMVIIFSLNTIGNLLAETMLEKAIFTPLTILLALMSYRLTKK